MRLLVCIFNELVKHHVLYEWTMTVQNELETTPINISNLDSTPLKNQNVSVPNVCLIFKYFYKYCF